MGKLTRLSTPNAGCKSLETNFVFAHPQTPPVIFGKPFIVPSLRIRVIESGAGNPLIRKELIVRYVWRWLEYPYQEHPFGAWSDAYDLMRCVTDQNGMIIIAEHKVIPSGWYKGKYSLGHKPSFQHLDISVNTGRSITHREIKQKFLEDLRRRNESDIVMTVSSENSALYPPTSHSTRFAISLDASLIDCSRVNSGVARGGALTVRHIRTIVER